MIQSALSQTVRAFERRLDLNLLNRTTRSVSPPEAGDRLYESVSPRFADIEAELAVLRELRGKPAGSVRITATKHDVRTMIWPRLETRIPKYPDINIEISSDNLFTDIVANRFDIDVRSGAVVAKDMIAVRMAPDMRMAVVGSPTYFARHPRPIAPQDLTEHDCVSMRLPMHGGLMAWEFKRRGRSLDAYVKARLVFNSSALMVAATGDDGGAKSIRSALPATSKLGPMYARAHLFAATIG